MTAVIKMLKKLTFVRVLRLSHFFEPVFWQLSLRAAGDAGKFLKPLRFECGPVDTPFQGLRSPSP